MRGVFGVLRSEFGVLDPASCPVAFYGANSANVVRADEMPSVKGGRALVAGWVPCGIRRGPSKRQGKSRATTDEYIFLAF